LVQQLNFFDLKEMSYLIHHTGLAGIFHVDFNRLVHLSQAERLQGVFLILGSADTASDLGDSNFLHVFNRF
jgi:hypothetical protein